MTELNFANAEAYASEYVSAREWDYEYVKESAWKAARAGYLKALDDGGALAEATGRVIRAAENSFPRPGCPTFEARRAELRTALAALQKARGA